MMRRVTAQSCSKFLQKTTAGVKVAPQIIRAHSTTFPEKERVEETLYIKNEEARYRAEMRANLERILALEKHHEERKEITELLTPKVAEEKSWISKIGLDDWKIALPLGIVAAVPLLSNEIYVMSAETQLLAVFIFSLSTMYSQAGGMIAKGLDDYRDEIRVKFQKVDEVCLAEVNATKRATEELLTLEAEVKEIHEIVDHLSNVQASVLNHAEEHKYRDAIVKKLDALAAVEDTVSNAVRVRMVNAVKADVVKTFTNDRAARDAALDQAIAVLNAGSSGKMGKDVVGEAFQTALKNYGQTYAKSNPDQDELLIQLKKDIAAIAVAPVVDPSSGTNVYESHKLIHSK